MSDESIVVNRNTLNRYEESVSALKLAMRDSSSKSDKAIAALREFLLDWLGNEKRQQNAIDAENYYFSKKMAEQAIAIFKDNATVSSKNISTYVKNAIASIDLDDFLFSKKDVEAFEKKVKSELQSIIDSIEEKKDGSKSESESDKSAIEKTISETVKKNLHIAPIDQFLYIIPNFLEKNVFSNIRGILKGQAVNFENSTLKIIQSKHLGSKNIFTSLYVPDISRLYKQFKRFEYAASRGIIYKSRAIIKRAAKRIKQQLDFFFPFGLVAKILKTGAFLIGSGIKVVKGTLRLGIDFISGTLHFAFNTIKLVTGAMLKIGSASIKLLTKTLEKIGAFKLLKLTAKGMFAFLKTYAGAYLLGYVVGSIYRNFKKIFDFAKGLFNVAKTWFNDNIYTPWLEPMLNWFQESGYSFYLKELGDAFGEGSVLSESIENIVDEFTLYDRNGKPLLDFGQISRKISWLTSWMQENFTGANIKDIVLDNVAPMAGGMLGSIAGAHLGAALGTMIFPGIGTVAGGIIFSLLGGIAGENLGGIIRELIQDNAPFTKVERHETALEKFSRQNFGLRNQQKAAFFTPSKTEAIKTLQKVGSKASEFDFMDEKSYESLVSSGLFSIDEIRERTAGIKSADFQKQIAMFKNIGNLSYDNVYKEISSSFTAMGERLLNPAHKGAIFKDDIRDSDWDTYLTLGQGIERLQKQENANPFWFKIIRAMRIQQNLNDLANGVMKPLQFLELYNEMSSGNEKAFTKAGSSIKFNGSDVDIQQLIWGRNQNQPSEKEFSTWQEEYANYYGEIEFKKDPISRTPAGGSARRMFTNRYRPVAKEKIIPSNLIYWVPTDTNTGFWKKLFAGRQLETQDIRNIFKENVAINRANAFKLTSKEFLQQYGGVYNELLKENPNYIEAKTENVLYRLGLLTKGEGFNSLSKDQIRAAIKAELAGGDYTSIEMVEQMLGNKLQTAIDKITAERSSDGRQVIDEFNKIPIDSDFIGMANIISEYRSIINANSDFVKEKLLPFLKALSDKGMSSDEIGHMFGFIYNAGSNSVEQYVEIPTNGDVAPNDGM